MTTFIPLIAAALTLGLLAAPALPLGPFTLLLLGCLALVAAAITRQWLPWIAAAVLAAAALGASLHSSTNAAHRASCHVAHQVSRSVVRLTATVEQPAEVTTRGPRLRLRAHRIQRGESATPVCGCVELRLPPGAPTLWPGARVLLRTRLRPAVGARNPGVAGAGPRYRSKDVGAVAWADPRDLVLLARQRPALLDRLRQRLRRALDRAVQQPEQRAVLGALVLGDRHGISPAARQLHARAGVSHLLAISGLHLGLVAGGVLLLVQRLILLLLPGLAQRTDPRRPAAAAAALVALAYTLLTGASPPTVRACVMTCAVLLGLVWARPPDLLRPLALAWALLLLWDPLNLWRAGVQLSFTAVVGISLAARRWPGASGQGPLRWLRALASTTTAATLVTAPVVAYHFGQVSVVGLVTNLVAIPWTSFVLLPLGLVGAAVATVWPWAGEPLLRAAGWAAGRLTLLCEVVGASELATVRWAPSRSALLGLALLGAALLLLRDRARKVTLLLALAVLGVAGVARLMPREKQLELTFIDVGQGDSTLVRLPDGGNVLVDGGGSLLGPRPGQPGPPYDPGAARVVPLLRAAGIERLHLVVATHPHPDHVGGLGAVLDAVQVDELWTCWHEEPNPLHLALLERARRRGVKVARPRLLRRGAAVIRPLWPAGYQGACADPGHSANDNSIVLRLELGRGAVLLPGDIERDVEALLVRGQRDLLRADVLKAPHHGSGTSSSATFLRAVAPRLAVISCGLDNSFGIPPPAVVRRYQRLGIPLARVDLRGAVTVRVDALGRVRWQGQQDDQRQQPPRSLAPSKELVDFAVP